MSIKIFTKELDMNLLEDISSKNEDNATSYEGDFEVDLERDSVVVYQKFGYLNGYPVGLISATLLLLQNDQVLLSMNVQEYITHKGNLLPADSHYSLLRNAGFVSRYERYLAALKQAGIVGPDALANSSATIRVLLERAYTLAVENCPTFSGEVPEVVEIDIDYENISFSSYT